MAKKTQDLKITDKELENIQGKVKVIQSFEANIGRAEVSKMVISDKKIINIILDPDLETADIDTSNNSWPKKQEDSEFDKFKNKIKG